MYPSQWHPSLHLVLARCWANDGKHSPGISPHYIEVGYKYNGHRAQNTNVTVSLDKNHCNITVSLTPKLFMGNLSVHRFITLHGHFRWQWCFTEWHQRGDNRYTIMTCDNMPILWSNSRYFAPIITHLHLHSTPDLQPVWAVINLSFALIGDFELHLTWSVGTNTLCPGTLASISNRASNAHSGGHASTHVLVGMLGLGRVYRPVSTVAAVQDMG